MTYPPGGPPPQGPYGAPPPYGQPQPMGPYGPPPNKSSKTGLFVTLGAVGAAVVVVLVLALAGVFGGDDDEADTPAAAVSATLDAAKGGDRQALLRTLCRADRVSAASGSMDGTTTDSTIDSYSIGKTTEQGESRARVDLTIESTSGKSSRAAYITRKEDGRWRVCIRDTIASTPSSDAASDPADDYDSDAVDDPDYSYDPAPSDSPTPDYRSSAPSTTYGGRYKTPSPGETITIPGGSTVVLPDDLPTSR